MQAQGFILGLVMVLATLTGITNASAVECPPVRRVANTDPLAGSAPPAPVQVTGITRTNVDHSIQIQNPGEFGPHTYNASYCLYAPPTKAPAGILLYNHGAHLEEKGALDPMLQFIAQRGYFVVYPYIVEPLDSRRYPSLARAALKHALQQIHTQNIAVAGHSLGAMAAVRVAAMWEQSPPIRTIILHDPAGLDFFGLVNTYGEYGTYAPRSDGKVVTDALQSIPCTTHLLIIQSQETVNQTNSAALPIWYSLPQIARYADKKTQSFRRNFLRIPDDRKSGPARAPVLASSLHLTVEAPPLTSMDYYGYWRPFLGALNEVFRGTSFMDKKGSSAYCNRTGTVTAGCATTRYMGVWRDGSAASPMKNAADLNLFTGTGIPLHCPVAPVKILDPAPGR